jgi:putative ABC transport system permease protein
MRIWWSKIRALFTRGQLDHEVRAELDAHFEMEVEANLESGMSRSEAQARAARLFGNRTLIEESAREAWLFSGCETMLQDVRFAFRTLRRSPGFALSAAAVTALGICATTTVFTVVNGVLLRPLPYRQAEQLMVLWGDLRNRQVTDFPFAPGDFHDLRESAAAFEQLAAVVPERLTVWGDHRTPERVRAAIVTPNLLALLGARIAAGRDFVDADGAPRAHSEVLAPPQPDQRAPAFVAAILSHGFWQRRYGGDPHVVGRVADLGDTRAEVVGVLAPGFELLFPPGSGLDPAPDIYVAARVNYETGSRMNVSLRVVGRLRPDATLEEAQQQLNQIADGLRQRYPIKAAAGYHIRAEPLHDDLVEDARAPLAALTVAVAFVLLIACANVANLLLLRVAVRTNEFAVRAALGGSRFRLLRQLLMESFTLAGAGALLGLALTMLSMRAVTAFAPANLPRIGSAGIDARVLLFGVTAAMITAVLFGAVPALRAARAQPWRLLRGGGRPPGLGRGQGLRDVVVAGEVALSFVLLIGAGLMLRSFAELQRAYPGYQPSGVLTFAVENVRSRGPEDRALFVRELRRRLAALPGVEAVAAAQSVPLDGQAGNVRWGTEAAAADPAAFQQASANFVLPGYFETLRTALLEGRTFAEEDDRSDSRHIIIDRVLAAKAFPNTSAIGRRLLVRSRRQEPEWLEVIGVVDHQRIFSPALDGRETIFFVNGFVDHAAASKWLVRARGEHAELTQLVQQAVSELSPTSAVADVQPMRTLVERAAAPMRFVLVIIGTFAAVAVVLASVGLYGVLATAVRQRTPEIGIRIALGASARSIATLVLQRGLRVSLAGLTLGCASAGALTRYMASQLVGVSPTDVSTFAIAALGFLAVSAAATSLPASRAARVDPVAALRE